MIRAVAILGIIACRYLVKGYYENCYISAPEIAEQYNTNVRALMPALHQLTRAGILRSRVGGNEPGFIYMKDPKEISLYQILVAMEGETHFEFCKKLVADLKCDCTDSSGCGILELFQAIIDNASNQLSAITIAEHTGINRT